jgi:UrcA family protein
MATEAASTMLSPTQMHLLAKSKLRLPTRNPDRLRTINPPNRRRFMKTSKLNALSAVLLSVALANVTTSVSAAESSGPTKVVKVADLNLANPVDAKEMVRRISDAAGRVCRMSASPVYLNSARVYRNCVKDAIEASIQQVNDQRLTDAYRGGSERFAAK